MACRCSVRTLPLLSLAESGPAAAITLASLRATLNAAGRSLCGLEDRSAWEETSKSALIQELALGENSSHSFIANAVANIAILSCF